MEDQLEHIACKFLHVRSRFVSYTQSVHKIFASENSAESLLRVRCWLGLGAIKELNQPLFQQIFGKQKKGGWLADWLPY